MQRYKAFFSPNVEISFLLCYNVSGKVFYEVAFLAKQNNCREPFMLDSKNRADRRVRSRFDSVCPQIIGKKPLPQSVMASPTGVTFAISVWKQQKNEEELNIKGATP